ncbi:hypothetical protein KAZ01_00435, partial [Candidatus Gracilibacteria bacterium]|nr:hypothetical protein [Candidatus Gracilibacteria bacterium]
DQKENENGLSIITKLNYPAGFLKIFIGFMHYIHENISSNNLKVNNDSNGIEYIIEVNKLLKNVFNIYSKSSLEHNKKLFYKIIEIISKVKIEIKHKNNYSKETILIFTKLEKAKQGRNDILIIKGSNNNIKFSNNSAFFNKEILTFQKGFADTKITDLFLLINGLLNSISHDLSYSLDVIYKYLNYNHASKSVLQTLKKHLNKGKKKAFFKYYEIKDGKIAFSKREKSISNKTKNK